MTKLAPQYDPSAIETAIYRRWEDAGVFGADVRSEREPYVIVIPPPNVTAVLHSGHGLNNTLQDVLIRFERMRGREALWLPGTDHAGIATQNMVERALREDEGKTRQDLGREAFLERVWEHVNRTGGTILEQLRAIGCSCDWSRTRFTLDEKYSLAVRRVFVDLHEQGLIYRGQRVIHWCPRCRTSLSDEEAEFVDRDDHLYYIRYRLIDGEKGNGDSTNWVTVATTRPETMFGDVCLVYHPEDERFQEFHNATVEIPLSEVRIPIRTSTVVERDFGTGLLKVTPAHDANDFDIADSLGGFERPVTMDEDARMLDDPRVPEELRGLDRFEAREKILKLLDTAGQLERVDPYSHAVRQCYRCQTIVEPRLSDQWFVKMRPLAEPALKAYREGRLRFVPERWGKVYEHWLMQIRDWNISRQLWWGHRIPAWYCEQCDHITVTMDEPASCEGCGGTVRQDEDVLDTWFSSWLWPFATFGWPEKTADLEAFYPGHTLVTGPDIIFFWVARMVMAGYHFMGDRPFNTVYMNGIVRDPLHRAFSKSLGNGIDPLEVVERYGSDAFRFTIVAGAAAGTDMIMDRNDLDGTFAAGRNFANKLWNVGRLILANIGNGSAPDTIDPAHLELADRWILSRCQRTITAITDELQRFRLNDAANEIYHFVWDDLADWYIEQVKPRLYGSADGGDTARAVLRYVFEASLRLLHPIMPFITEQLWESLPGQRDALLAAASWPCASDPLEDEEAEHRFARVQSLVGAVRAVRAEYGVAPGKMVTARVQPASTDALEAFNAEQHTIERLAKIEALSMDGGETDGIGAHQVLPDGSTVFVPLGDAIDVAKECQRLTGELQRLEKQLAGVKSKLDNENFVNRAPGDVVEREREKERSWQEQREALAAKLRVLGC
jgi:valyl-tRNA synthetase